MGDQDTVKPIEAMLEILEDPPTKKTLPHDGIAGQCDPLCTNATESVCISGYKTLGKPRFSLKRWREKKNHDEDEGQWIYNDWFSGEQAFILKKGGLAANDIKSQWMTSSKDSNELKFRFEAKQYGFIAIEADGINDAVRKKKVEIIINEIDLKSNGKISTSPKYKDHGKHLECLDVKNKDVVRDRWALRSNGCNIGGLQPYQKYEILFNVVEKMTFSVKNIRIF